MARLVLNATKPEVWPGLDKREKFSFFMSAREICCFCFLTSYPSSLVREIVVGDREGGKGVERGCKGERF